MPRPPAETRVTQARNLKSADEARRLYGDWATDYDNDIAEQLQFTGSTDIANLLAAHLDNRTARILDLGCGTGLVGAELHRLGYTRLDGLDLSPEMLNVARPKKLYQSLIEADLQQPLDIPDATYDAAVSAGTFTSGHTGADRLDEILRTLKPSGILACVIASDVWDSGGFAGKLEQLQTSQRISLAHHSINPIARTGSAKGHFCVVILGE